jgi:hypothetical protein
MNILPVLNTATTPNCHLVTADDTDIIAQLIGNKADKVHPIEKTIDGFIADRVGGVDCTHQTWTKLDDNREVLAALYTARFENPIVNPSHICGNVSGVLSAKSAFVAATPPSSLIFYSISSFARGAGVDLISAVHDDMTQWSPNMSLSTLSPLRTFSKWLEDNVGGDINDLRRDTERVKYLALQYMSQNTDPVQRFHLRNGAYVADINVNANVEGSVDYDGGMGVMVNYGYPSKSKRGELQQAYALNAIPVSSHLIKQGNVSQNGAVFAQFNP